MIICNIIISLCLKYKIYGYFKISVEYYIRVQKKYGGRKMSTKHKIYKITITEDGLANYKSKSISAKDMAENLGIDSVMDDFEWDENVDKGQILTARIIDDISEQDALGEVKNAEYIESVEKS
jgi:repressor of nif and glnA expression